MALLWVEGFETFGTTIGIAPVGHDRKYTAGAPTGHRIRAGRTAGFSIELSSTGHNLQLPVAGDPATAVIGFGFKVAALGNHLYVFFRSAGQNNTTWSLNPDGSMDIGRGVTVLGTTATGLITADTWFYIEIKTTINNTTGAYELKLDGLTVLSDTNVDTQDSTNPTIDFILIRGNVAIEYDDFYILDTTGAKNNGFLGASIITSMFPNAAGDFTDFAPDTGSNFARVNENPTDDDTSFVESSTTGDKDLHNQDNISPSGIIRGVQVNTEVRDTITGGSSLKTLVKSGATTDTGPADTIAGTSYEYFTRVLEDDPNISDDWVLATLDTVQVGYEVG